MFKVVGTDSYLRKVATWTKREQRIANKLPEKLKENPHKGRPLGYPYMREQRVGGKRIYYLIYEDLQLVLLVATSEKKNQQRTIDAIKNDLDDFRRVAEDITEF